MKKVYTPEIKKFILKHYKGISSKQLVVMINKKFGLELTTYAVKGYLGKNKLKTEYKHNPKYTVEIIEYIIKNFHGKSNIELSEEVNEKFNTNFNNNSITNFKARMLIRKGIDLKTGINPGCYQYGRRPTNAIKKGQRMSPATEFKKGNKPINWVPIGTERIGKDGYAEIKVQDGQLQKNWKGKHVVLWEKINGPIPNGYALLFADKNKMNLNINNLILVSRAELLILNSKDLISNDPEITKTGTIIAKVINKTNKRKKGDS